MPQPHLIKRWAPLFAHLLSKDFNHPLCVCLPLLLGRGTLLQDHHRILTQYVKIAICHPFISVRKAEIRFACLYEPWCLAWRPKPARRQSAHVLQTDKESLGSNGTSTRDQSPSVYPSKRAIAQLPMAQSYFQSHRTFLREQTCIARKFNGSPFGDWKHLNYIYQNK